jgi:hypothetical protein
MIWRAKGTGKRRGVVALGEVLSNPEEIEEPRASRRFWVGPPEVRPLRRVRIRYVVPPRAPLWLEEDRSGALAELSVVKATGGGVFKVTPSQWRRVVEALGGWPDEDDEVEAAAEAAEAGRLGGQGFSVSPKVRKAVEEHAMQVATDYFEARGYEVVTKGKPYDLCCTLGGKVIHVEVKGTQTAGASVVLTKNEVRHQREHHPNNALFVLYNVQVSTDPENPVASGGDARVLMPWNIAEDGKLTPMTYDYELPEQP